MENKIYMLSLSDLIDSWKQNEIENFVESFSNNGLNHDIEDFLKHKSIYFEKANIARTTLILKNNQIVGYFSIANKPLVIDKEAWCNLSINMKRKLMPGFNVKNIIPPVSPQAILIGQLGKNFNVTPSLEGKEILSLAEAQVYKAQRISGGRFAWLECDKEKKLIDFYTSNGYQVLGQTNASQLLFIKKI